ncbi:O-antigen polymerase [Methanocaldococcus villosus KIN24-T80]|uniref:O-antigen polymerase n=1 Tax=Methanocaldococcus villosus KIN24-T80 TaxID=1069083 RepID=N6V3A9_9EURY|nr:O-antigen polymerase [Methanocaldococcus villosus]ENN96743.1 O-antigen polymerase [Methanocaldococcus villosus KIN24-T80]
MFKKAFKIEHPVNIIFIGHLIIFLLAFPYYDKLGFSIFKIIFIILSNILTFSIPFILDIKVKINKTIYYISSILLAFISFYGAFVITKCLFLSILYVIFIFIVVEIFLKYYYKKIFNIFLFVIGVLSFLLLVIKYKAIPLLNYNVRMLINYEPLRIISLGALAYSGIESWKYFLLSLVILSLTGYKVGPVILFTSYLIYKKYPIKKITIFGSILILLILIMNKIILSTSGQCWKLSTIEVLCYRAYLDLYIFKSIIENHITTYGSIILTPGGEEKIGELLFSYKHNFTTTMFGTVYMDFNIFSPIFSIIFGIISKFLYEGDWKLYSIYASLLLIYCEIGINYGFLVVILLLFYINICKVIKYEIYNKN